MKNLSYTEAQNLLENVKLEDLQNYHFPIELLDQYAHTFKNGHWERISLHQKLSSIFIQKHKDKLNWTTISRFQKLSKAIITQNHDKVNWQLICEHQQLSEKIIQKHINKVHWFNVSIHQELSTTFIIQNIKNIYLEHLLRFNKKIDKELIQTTLKLSL
jgi:hypothetical protein